MAKVAVVTGANQGIGFAIVRKLCKEHPDWIVYGTSRNPATGEKACETLKGEGLTARYVEADLASEPTIVALKEKMVKEHGGIDVLVNNAGILVEHATTGPCTVDAEVNMNTNVFGTNMVCEQLFPILKDGARVVVLTGFFGLRALHTVKEFNPAKYESYIKSDPVMDVGSVLQSMRDCAEDVKAGNIAKDGWESFTLYSMSKMGCSLLARAYQQEFSKTPERDIVVNAGDPGSVSTNMNNYKGVATIDEGAGTPCYLASLPPRTVIRGEHVSNRKVVPWM